MSEFLGVDVSFVDAVGAQRFPLGTKYRDNLGNAWVYIKAGGTIVAKDNIAIAASFVGSALAAAGIIDAISLVGAIVNEFLWVQTEGVVTAAKVAAGLANNALFPRVAEAAGKIQALPGAYSATIWGVRGRTLSAEAGGFADVRLYAW